MLEIKPVKTNTTELDDFLALPKQIYRPDHLMQSEEEELALIEGSHPLSSDLETYAFVGYMNSRPCIRGLLTFYPDDEAAYLGFFESINDQQIASAFIEHLAGFARSLGAIKIIGPVQASFWLGYRMQLTGTEELPFTGEPHNLAYYPQLWQAAGFEIKELYLSIRTSWLIALSLLKKQVSLFALQRSRSGKKLRCRFLSSSIASIKIFRFIGLFPVSSSVRFFRNTSIFLIFLWLS